MNNLTINAIADAVAKQQPKKVVVKTTYYDELIAYDTYKTMETKRYSCPTCERPIIYYRPKYCDDCGQRLDWEGCK